MSRTQPLPSAPPEDPMLSAGTAPEPIARPVPARTALWDNARLLVMALVVFGHLIETLRGTAAVDYAYSLVYAFHMPAFILMAGFFARSDRLGVKQFVATAQLVVTWLALEFAWAGFRAVTGHRPFSDTFLVIPGWTYWFLVTLFVLRIVLPYLAVAPVPLLVSVVVSLGAGLIASIGQPFSMSRTLSLLPFFVLGWQLRRWKVDERRWFRAPGWRIRTAAVGVLAAAAVAVALLMRVPGYTFAWLFWRKSYSALHVGAAEGLLMRAGLLLLAAAIILAVLVLIPRRSGWYSRLGENTLYVYLLHAPIIRAIRYLHIDRVIGHVPFSLVVAALLAVALTLVLALPPVRSVTRFVVEPRWVFARALRAAPKPA